MMQFFLLSKFFANLFMEKYAHKKDTNEKQTIKEHLYKTAKLAEQNAVDVFRSAAHAIGMAHDIGKYANAFQDRLNGGKGKFEHSACGAIEYRKFLKTDRFAPMIEYCIACHHTGLQDGGAGLLEGTMSYRISEKREKEYTGDWDYSDYKDEIILETPDFNLIKNYFRNLKSEKDFIELYAFFTKYLFSCLVDADFIETETFCKSDVKRGLQANFQKAKEYLSDKLSKMPSSSALQAARSRIQEQAYENSKENTKISILNMPTGSGKTLCSLKIALDKVLFDKSKKRIIYVIPYMGIIEQTAKEFNDIFGEVVDILQHHSNYSFEQEGDSENQTTMEKLKYASENWDAPMIITTAVQFFESLCHYKTSSLRKMHNMANAVIVFDEIHTLPVECLQPCIRGIGYITKYLNSEAIFLSATMPDYTKLFEKYVPECSISYLVKNTSDFRYFKKAEYITLGRRDFETIAQKAIEFKQSLIITNSKKAAKGLYQLVSGNKYHLSTFMTPIDREKTIESIKRDLHNGKQITVVSTSLIEAGIDLDFEAVFRELNGLDSILQAGGRSNREGKREKGFVFIFERDNDKVSKEIRINTTKKLLETYEDITSKECIEQYYNEIFFFNEKQIESNSIAEGVKNFSEIPFKTYAKSFKLIKDASVGIIINQDENSNRLLEHLKEGDRTVLRSLQRYIVSLKYNQWENCEFNIAFEKGIIDDCNGVFVLNNTKYYKEETGLDIEFNDDMIYG